MTAAKFLMRSNVNRANEHSDFVRLAPGGAITVMQAEDYSALGLIDGVNVYNKFGYNLDVDNSATETVWSTGGRVPFQSTARKLQVVSTSDNDKAGGNGMTSIEIRGIDANRNVQIETVTLNGTTTVETDGTWLGVNRVVGRSYVGGANVATGNINGTFKTDDTAAFQVPAAGSVTQQLIYHTGNATSVLIKDFFINIRKLAGGQDVRATIMANVFEFDTGGLFEIFRHNIDTGVENTVQFTPAITFPISANSLVEITASTDKNDTVVAGRFTLIEYTQEALRP